MQFTPPTQGLIDTIYCVLDTRLQRVKDTHYVTDLGGIFATQSLVLNSENLPQDSLLGISHTPPGCCCSGVAVELAFQPNLIEHV